MRYNYRILRHVETRKRVRAHKEEVSPLRSYWVNDKGLRICQVGLEGLKGWEFLNAYTRSRRKPSMINAK